MGRHRKRGRPKGSKNKPGHRAGRPRKDFFGAVSRARSLDESEFRRLRGRPRKTTVNKAESVALMAIPNKAGHKKVIFVGYMKTK